MWKEITESQYRSLFEYFKPRLQVFSSFTDTEGQEPFGTGKPHIVTEWGNPTHDYAIIKSESSKENTEQKEWVNKYYLFDKNA